MTTDLVIAELHGLALGRLGPETALELVERLMASPRLSVVATGPEILADALESLRRRPGRRISLVDAAYDIAGWSRAAQHANVVT